MVACKSQRGCDQAGAADAGDPQVTLRVGVLRFEKAQRAVVVARLRGDVQGVRALPDLHGQVGGEAAERTQREAWRRVAEARCLRGTCIAYGFGEHEQHAVTEHHDFEQDFRHAQPAQEGDQVDHRRRQREEEHRGQRAE